MSRRHRTLLLLASPLGAYAFAASWTGWVTGAAAAAWCLAGMVMMYGLTTEPFRRPKTNTRPHPNGNRQHQD